MHVVCRESTQYPTRESKTKRKTKTKREREREREREEERRLSSWVDARQRTDERIVLSA